MPHPGPVNPASTSDLAKPGNHGNRGNRGNRADTSSPASDIVRISLAGLNGTGDPRVDEAVAQLGRLDDAPLAEHPAILGQVHDRLREVLGELSPGGDQRPTGTP